MARLSFPSGSAAGAAAVAAAVALAVPVGWRTATVAVGSVYALFMAVAVVSLQWHYPTDTLAGLAYGTGVVLLVDVAVSTLGGMVRTRAGRRSTPSPGGLTLLGPLGHRWSSDDGHGVGRTVRVELQVDGAVGVLGLPRCLDDEGRLLTGQLQGLLQAHGDAGHDHPGGGALHASC